MKTHLTGLDTISLIAMPGSANKCFSHFEKAAKLKTYVLDCAGKIKDSSLKPNLEKAAKLETCKCRQQLQSPGCSWQVGGRGSVHSFPSADKRHEKDKERQNTKKDKKPVGGRGLVRNFPGADKKT